LEGTIQLNGKILEECKTNEKDFANEIEKINKEIQMIHSSQGKINEDFEKVKKTIIDSLEKKLDLATQDFELTRLEERKNVDLSKADEKKKLLQSYNLKLEQMKKMVISLGDQCTEYMKAIKEAETNLNVTKQLIT